MISRGLFLAIAGLSLASCDGVAPENAHTVPEVIADLSSEQSKLDGKIVAVRGWLGECAGLDCGIYQSLEDARLVESGDYRSTEWLAAMDRRLAVGSSEGFGLVASTMQFSEVVIYGEANAAWLKPVGEDETKFMCLDRCDDIKPHSIEKVLF